MKKVDKLFIFGIKAIFNELNKVNKKLDIQLRKIINLNLKINKILENKEKDNLDQLDQILNDKK